METSTLQPSTTSRPGSTSRPAGTHPDRWTPVQRAAAWLVWPVGLALTLVLVLGDLPRPLSLTLDLLYAAVVVWLAAAARQDRAGAALALAGPALFALVGLVGPPTARQPQLMLANTAALAAAAVTLLVATVLVALRLRHGPGAAPAALAVVALAVGSCGYLLNLLARWAVVLSGAAGQQAAVEDTAWTAEVYLTGLAGEPGPLTIMLVWLDLAQLAYLVLAYLGFGALAVALGRAGAVPPPTARWVGRAGMTLGALVTATAVLAGVLPGAAAGVAAGVAFGLTIPFMTTLLPYAVGVGLLRAARS